MPGWEKARLDDACIFLNGLWKGKKPPFVEAGVIRNTNFAQDGALDFSDIAYLDVEEKQIEKRRLQLGDIILEKSGGGPKQAVGRVALFNRAEENFSFSNFTSAIRIRDAKKLDYRYLHKYLHWIYVSGVTESMQSHSTGIRNLNGNAYKNIEIAIPALKEQQRIVAILDEAFAGIATAKANAEKNLQSARELLDSQLNLILERQGKEWVRKSLGELCEIARGGSPRPIKEYFTNSADGVNWIKISDASASSKYIYTTREKIKPSGVSRSRLVHSGDFLLSNSMSFGRPYIMRTSGCIHDGWLVLSGYEGAFDQDFLYLLLGSQHLYQQFDKLAAGSTVRNLNIDLASSVIMPVPSLEEQRLIAKNLGELSERVEQLQKVCERKLAVLDELKQSLLAKAFAGELT